MPPPPEVEALATDATAFQAGRVVGAVGATVQGIAEVNAGLGAIGGGAAACGTAVLCAAGAPAIAVGTVATAHGGSVAIRGAADAGQQLTILLAKGVNEYDVGPFNELQRNSQPGDGLDLHHAPQSHAAVQVVPGYQRNTGPAIALSEGEHAAVPRLTGPYQGSPRDLMATTLNNLRRYTEAPNSSLRKLLDLFRNQYPGVLDKQ